MGLDIPEEIKKKKFTLSGAMLIFLATLLIAASVYGVLLWIKVDKIDSKLDKAEYQTIRLIDSLKEASRDKEIIKIKREVNPPPDTIKRPPRVESEKLTPAKGDKNE